MSATDTMEPSATCHMVVLSATKLFAPPGFSGEKWLDTQQYYKQDLLKEQMNPFMGSMTI